MIVKDFVSSIPAFTARFVMLDTAENAAAPMAENFELTLSAAVDKLSRLKFFKLVDISCMLFEVSPKFKLVLSLSRLSIVVFIFRSNSELSNVIDTTRLSILGTVYLPPHRCCYFVKYRLYCWINVI